MLPVEPRKSFWSRHGTKLILTAIMLIAIFFRFYDRDFDQGTNQHPDERAIVDRTLQVSWPTNFSQLFDANTSPMNLRALGRYPWGTLPVYVVRGTTWVADQVAPIFNSNYRDHYYLRDYHGQQLVGRTMASIFDLISILLVFLIARRLYSTRTALIAAALVAFSVTNIQIAHFYITEPFLVTFMLAALYFSVRLMQKPTWWAAAGAGLFIGVSVASKVTSALIFAMVIAAVVLRAAYRLRSRKLGADLDDPVGMVPATARERSLSFKGHFLRGLRYVGIAALFTIIGFGISEPYVYWQFDFSRLQPIPGQSLPETFTNFLSSNPWGQAIVDEAGTQSGSEASNGIPFTRQYVGTIPVLYHFEQLVFWGVGIIPGISILAGIALALWLAIKRRPAEIILLACALPYFATILIGETKWMRYMLPLVAVFSIMSAAFLTRGAKWAAEKWPKNGVPRTARIRSLQRNFIPGFTVAAIAFAFLWSVAYMNIYTQEHSRVQAAEWASANLPAGATISHEGWDDELPNLVGLTGGGDYQWNLYDDHPADDELKYIKEMMAKTDVIAITSNRLYGSIPRLPWRYPVQTTFYQLLYAGKLGYVNVHTTQVTPEIFGIKFDDQKADESFTVYDHPRVDLFKKETTLTDDQMRTLFATALNFP
ncbi:MAG: glycosyltransferase family 39 protein, partial [Chloroflexia bacterium]